MTIVYLILSWFSGIWLAASYPLSATFYMAAGTVTLGGAVWLRRRARLTFVLACAGFAGMGGARYTAVLPQIDAHHIAYYNDHRDVTINGVVVNEPAVRDRSVDLRVAVEEIVLADGTTTAGRGLVQVRTFRFPVIAYGSRVRLTGDLETPPNDGDFDYRAYLARQRVHTLLTLPRVDVMATGAGSPAYHAILRLKTAARESIKQLFPEPQAALLTGILLGDDNGIPPDLAEAFRLTGMTHIIAISGSNIAILIAVLVSIGEPLLRSRRSAALFAVAGIVLYTILVGAEASVVRASVMGIIFLFTRRGLGRASFAFASLFLAGFLMTLVNPFTLWDVGFQLSFVATLSLMLYAEPGTRWTQARLQVVMSRERARSVMSVLSEAVIITLAAQILTLPLMIGTFQQVSLISLPANALILPVQSAVMLWGGLATLLGLVLPPLGQVVAWAAWLPLTYTIWLVRLLGAVPYAAVPVTLGWSGVIGLYGLIGGITWLAGQEASRRRRVWRMVRRNVSQRLALTGAVVTAVLVLSWGHSQPDGHLHIAFLNVGQGDATFIQTPSGRQILIDGGYFPSVLNDRLGQQLPFWDRDIDLVVATHPDADHVSGLVGVFERFQVARLLTDGSGWGESAIYDAVLQAASAQGTLVHQAVAGEKIIIDDGVLLEIDHPGSERDEANRNDNSVSMRLTYGDFSFLVTGDAETRAETQMLARGHDLQALVFKAGHHGSRGSTTQPFLEAVQPRIVVISAGVDNRFGHPHPEMLARAAAMGTAVLRTDQLGTIEMETDGRTMWWRARRE